MKYENETEYKSPLGGLFSIIGNAIVLSYFLYLLKIMLMRETFSVQESNLRMGAFDFKDVELDTSRFDIALKLDCPRCPAMGIEDHKGVHEYFSATITHIDYHFFPNETSFNKKHRNFFKVLPLTRCNNTRVTGVIGSMKPDA